MIKRVAVGGVFDGIHLGHLSVLQAARALAKQNCCPFIALLNSDFSLNQMKRERQHDEVQRAALVAGIVGATVILFDEPSPRAALDRLAHDLDPNELVLFVKGRDAIDTPGMPPEFFAERVALHYVPVIDGGRSHTKLKTRR